MENVTAVMILIKVSLRTLNITFCIAVMTTAASGGEDCEDTFDLDNNTMAFGGEGFGDARSVDECKAECLKVRSITVELSPCRDEDNLLPRDF